MDFKNITFYPEFFVDMVIYILLVVLVCLVSKGVYDWKVKRRLAKEFAEYQRQKEEEA